ncbi:elongator complex protein 5 [Ipomoea triloba]|uniref:elongator complex protein 5 n=1 Tax=Ipomoea triloba TaxID=35885 RepID=UPI00125CE888|nr:elongator complex protein 5 [Ipomoea triloba]
MAELICRNLRDGALEGEHAPALTLKDSIESPLGPLVFNHILSQLFSNISAAKSQSRGILLVALSRPPSFYAELLKCRGSDGGSSNKWLSVLDCYTDPLGWKSRLMERGTINNTSQNTSVNATLFTHVKDSNKLLASIVERGKEMVGEGKGRFSVAIDSISEMLRHSSIHSVARILSYLRSHDQVSSVFFLLNSDLHESKVASTLEYMSTMRADIVPVAQTINGQRVNSENLSVVEQNFKRGKLHVRFKRRNGRVRVTCEDACVEDSGIKFTPVSLEDGLTAQSLVPKVQFNLQLSEKERLDREKVVLPFEHQGNGKPIEIYDGRKSLNNTNEHGDASAKMPLTNDDSGKGEIIYFRDSDDEMPDSDEDPDDDLDI